MPNQYTKFRTATSRSEPRQFRWREFNGSHKPTRRRKHDAAGKYDNIVVLSDEQDKCSERCLTPELTSSSTSRSSWLQQYSPSSGFRIDPFQAFAVVPDRRELTVIDYFLHVLAPSGKHHDLPSTKWAMPKVDPHISLLLPFIMQKPPLYEAMLATCQASISLSCGVSAYGDEFFMLHRGRAMAGLRKQLEKDVDDSAILAVTMLITCDYLTGDIRAVEGHSKALQRMADVRTQMKLGQQSVESTWDKFVQHGLEGYKSICVLATGKRNDTGIGLPELEEEVSPFKPLVYPQPPFNPEQCEEWTKLPEGFLKLVLTSQLSTQLIAIILAISDLKPKASLGLFKLMKLIEPVQAAIQRFSQHVESTHLERCIAAGLLAYSFQFPRPQAANMFHDPPMRGIIRLLNIAHRSQSVTEQKAMIWVHMAVEGFLAARPVRLSGGPDVFQNAMLRYRPLRAWDQLVLVLEQFFFTPDLLDGWKICHEWHRSRHHTMDKFVPANSKVNQHLGLQDRFEQDTLIPAICPFSSETAAGGYSGSTSCPFSDRLK